MITIPKHIRTNPEFQSLLVRISVWLFGLVYISAKSSVGHDLDYVLYIWLFSIYLVVTLVQFASIFFIPVSNARRYASLVSDIVVTSLAMYLSGESISPFYILYIWIFVSYGTRYGKEYLRAASLISVMSYIIVCLALDQFGQYAFELFFMALFLVILPIYQNVLLTELQQARTFVEREHHAKASFLSTILHELQAPLSGVMHRSQALRLTQLDAEQCKILDSVDDSSRLMDDAIRDVSDLMQIETEQLILNAAEFNLRDLLVEILREFQSGTRPSEIEFLLQVDNKVPEVAYGDTGRIKQLLHHQVSNAIKMVKQGWIQISVIVNDPDQQIPYAHHCLTLGSRSYESRDLQTTFSDDSPGGDSRNSQLEHSLGISCSIVNELVRLMDGYIKRGISKHLDSQVQMHLPLMSHHYAGRQGLQASGILKGRWVLALEPNPVAADAIVAACKVARMPCTLVSDAKEFISKIHHVKKAFSFLLISDIPRGEDVEGIAMQARAMLGDYGDKVTVVYLHYVHRPIRLTDSHEVLLSKPWHSQQLWDAMLVGMGMKSSQPQLLNHSLEDEDKTQYKILVVEDDRVNSLLIERLLEKAGHKVVVAEDGEAAIQTALEEDFDLALVDLHLPELDGLSFSRRYREQSGESSSGYYGKRRLPIVALTTDDSDAARRASKKAGMDGFLNKPVKMKDLNQVIRSQIEKVI